MRLDRRCSGCVFPDILRAAMGESGALPLPAVRDHLIAAFYLADTQETGNPYPSKTSQAAGQSS